MTFTHRLGLIGYPPITAENLLDIEKEEVCEVLPFLIEVDPAADDHESVVLVLHAYHRADSPKLTTACFLLKGTPAHLLIGVR